MVSERAKFIRSVVDEYVETYHEPTGDPEYQEFQRNQVITAAATFLICYKQIKRLEESGQPIDFLDLESE